MVEPSSPAARQLRPPGPLHLTHVEGLRALAAYVVFINHAYAQVWMSAQMPTPPWYLSPFVYAMVAGHLSVTVFIVISGFCLMLPVARAGNQLRGGTAAFLQRRARRILPPYYGAVALCLVLIWTIIGRPTGTLWDFPIHVSSVAIVSHLLLLQDLFATSRINYVFWSIAVEWQIYFLFPLLVWSWRRYGPRVTVSGALLLGYALRLGFAPTRIARAAPHYLGLFALGMLAASLIETDRPSSVQLRDRLPWGRIGIACAALVCALTGAWGWRLATDRFHFIDLPVAIATMCVLVLTSRRQREHGGAPNPVTRLLSMKPLVFIGTFSYSVYLIHAPVLQILWQYGLVPAHLGPVAMFALLMGPGALAVLAVSYAFFRVFEAPFMRQSSGKRLARSPAEAAEAFTPAALHDPRAP